MRRWVASVMLVAFASFVLHNSAMAMVAASALAEEARVSGDRHAHGTVHEHGVGTAHLHAAAHGPASTESDGSAAPPDHNGAKGPCCGVFCATAITPRFAELAVSRIGGRVDLPTFEVTWLGIDHKALRKPPRTPDIA